MPRKRPRTFGTVRRLASGRLQASYVDPKGKRMTAPQTFATVKEADAWLGSIASAGPPSTVEVPTFKEWAEGWLAHGQKATAGGGAWSRRTRDMYERETAELIKEWGRWQLDAIRPADVVRWHAAMDASKGATRAHLYSAFRAIMIAAERAGIPTQRPYVAVIGGGKSPKRKQSDPLEPEQLAALVEAMPERLRLAVELGTWCGLRSGEVRELRRSDVDEEAGTVHVRRAVTYVVGDGYEAGDPKTDAGERLAYVPTHVVPRLVAHLADHVKPEPDALLFPSQAGTWLAHSTFHKPYDRARKAAGRPDLRFHDLRHTGATFMIAVGAGIRELMEAMGWDDLSMVKHYGKVRPERRRAIADALSAQYGQPVGQVDNG